MKKIFTAMAALALCSTAAFAQGVVLPSSIEFSPYDEDGEFLPSTEQVIHVTMDEVPSVPVTIMYVTGNGFGMNMDFKRIENPGASFDIQLTTADWGVPFNEMYYLNLIVTFTYGEGEDIEYYLNDDDEPVAFQAMYITPDTGDAAWAKNYPTERNFTEEGLTFARFYNVGECTFYFTKEVTLPSGSIGTITYTSEGEDTPERITTYTAEWDEEMGLYAVTVDVRNEDYTSADLEGIKISLTNVKNSKNEVINVPAIVVENTDATPKKAPKKGIANGLISNIETVNIYNVQGTLVKENVSANAVNELPAGLYIVNGKKVVVR